MPTRQSLTGIIPQRTALRLPRPVGPRNDTIDGAGVTNGPLLSNFFGTTRAYFFAFRDSCRIRFFHTRQKGRKPPYNLVNCITVFLLPQYAGC